MGRPAGKRERIYRNSGMRATETIAELSTRVFLGQSMA